jgi:subtilisin family serine protease
VQALWPLDGEAAFGALPTPLRMHADPRFTGAGVTVALVDAGFYPHNDLVRPLNRIQAWADAGGSRVRARFYRPDEIPVWEGWDAASSRQWHGLMTSTVAAGNGGLAHGFYRGLASAADVVLVQVLNPDGRISNEGIVRALTWLLKRKDELGLCVVSLSVAGDAVSPLEFNPVDEAVHALVERSVLVVAAAGNDGVRRLVPPATGRPRRSPLADWTTATRSTTRSGCSGTRTTARRRAMRPSPRSWPRASGSWLWSCPAATWRARRASSSLGGRGGPARLMRVGLPSWIPPTSASPA